MGHRTTAADAGLVPLGDHAVARIGYGATQLAGYSAMGMPAAAHEVEAVLHKAIELGVTHIDIDDLFGPQHIANQMLHRALYPYPETLTFATKVGVARARDGSFLPATSPKELQRAVHNNLRSLRVEALDVVYLRLNRLQLPQAHHPAEEQLAVLTRLREKGSIKYLGLCNVHVGNLRQLREVAPITCVQNMYNIANRDAETVLSECEATGLVFVPASPMRCLTPAALTVLGESATFLNTSIAQVALAWLLERSPNVLLVPSTSKTAHLKENIEAASLKLPSEITKKLNIVPSIRAVTANRRGSSN
ncbi:oxidoreductase [Mycobacteroides abscessus subsp. bolletii]|uniref:oxidoreductase n=1 Tax=Mycobacteroides abscessus TaxID=36809 RepID=UPI0019CF775A|nr:oxidoreductase [Mycobacteroides abscessus]MBN7303145.1 oxidoreductase [Mycobacteroides abscessus subsp. bolletii]